MIPDNFKELVFAFAREASCADVNRIVLFGSVAEGTADNRSDVDLCVVFDTEAGDFEQGASRDIISTAALSLEKKYDRTIQLIFTNRIFAGIDSYLAEKIAAEGIVLFARSSRLGSGSSLLAPFMLVTCHTEKMSRNARQKLTRALYGYRTRKQVKDKTYRTAKQGLVAERGGKKIDVNTFLVPAHQAGSVREVLENCGTAFTMAGVWIAEDSLIKLKRPRVP